MPRPIASLRAEERDRLALDRDRPGVEPVGAEDRARGFGAAGADEAGEAEDFALVGAQRDVDQFDRVRIARVAPARQALDLERDRPCSGIGRSP